MWWGRNGSVPSHYLALSRKFILSKDNNFNSLTFHLGGGTGYYVSETHHSKLAVKKRAGENAHDFSEWGVFGGASLGVIKPINAIVNWTGQNLDAGFSIAPFSQEKLILNLFARDILDTAGSGVLWSIMGVYSVNLQDLF